MADHKREADFEVDNVLVKRPKHADADADAGVVEDRTEKLDTDVLARNQSASTETNGGNGSNLQREHSVDNAKDTRIHEMNSPPEEKISHDSEVNLDGSKVFCIDADAAEDRGSRRTMEDSWVVLPDASLGYPGKLRCAHFAIYDGHGGRLAAEYAQYHLHANVLSAGLPRELMDIKAAKKAILEGFRRTDEYLLKESTQDNWQEGATAVCVWVLGQTVLVANIGDAKAVLARSSGAADGSTGLSNETGSHLKAIVVTREHKPIYPQERARIQKAGGYVGPNGRLQGRLEVSRAFGDRQFKKVGVTAIPDIHSFELTEREQFLILGCDGLWGVFGASDAVEFVEKQLQQEKATASIASRRLVREAVRERGCKDNCTAIVIVFKHH